VVFVAFLDLFSQFPIVAPFARSLGAAPLLVAIAVAAYDAANLVGNLGAGYVLQAWGRRRSLVAGLLAAAAALVFYGRGGGIFAFAVVRALHGLAQAILSPGAFAVLSDAVPAPRRAQAMGTAGVFIAVAAVLGPPLAGVGADRVGPQAVFVAIAALLAGTAAVVAAGKMESSPSALDGAAAHPAAARHPISLVALLARPRLRAAYAACLAWTAAIGTLVVHLPLVLETRGAPASARGGAFGTYALVALVAMAGPAPWLAHRYGRERPLAGGLALIGAALLALAIAGTTGGVYAAMALFGLGFGALFPAATALVADASASHERGAAYGIFYATYSLGVVVGEVGSGQLAGVLGPQTVAPFVVFGLLALLMAPAVLLLRRRVAVLSPAGS
jgi:MFS family permease